MTAPGRDPLDDLRAAWREVRPPPRADELDATDPATRDAVRWLQTAWRALPPPGARALRPLRPLRRWSAAAVLLAGVALGLLWNAARREVPAPVPPAVVQTPAPAAKAADEAADVKLLMIGRAVTASLAPAPFAPVPVHTVSAEDDLLDRLIQSNRSGAWSEAADLASRALEGGNGSRTQRCGALYQMALSFECLGRRDESIACLTRLERELRAP